MARKISLPAFTLIDDGKVIEKFDGYDELYTWASNMRKEYPTLLGTVTGDARIVILFGEVPLKYDLKSHKLYELSWHEVDNKR